MHTIFVIPALCFFALLLAAIAIVRRVHIRRRSTAAQQDFAQHLFAAAEDQNSRVPHTLRQQTVREILEKKSWDDSPAMAVASADIQTPESPLPKRF